MTRTLAVVWNPTKVDEDELREAVGAVFATDSDVRWLATTADDPGRGMAEDAIGAGCDTVVAVGGDGTVRAVAEGLAGQDVALGIVPRGTGNLLARNLDVPLDDLTAALERIRDGEPRRIDLGWFRQGEEEQAFAVMIGFGIDAQMLVETDDNLKERAGWLAYVEAMGRAVAGAEMTGMRIALDEDEPQAVEAHTVLIGNCGLLQGGIRLLPDAEVDDGQLDLLVVSADGALQWLGAVRSVVWDNGIRRMFGAPEEAVSTESTRHLTAREVRVELDAPRRFEIDGEEIGEVSAFQVRVQPGALLVH